MGFLALAALCVGIAPMLFALPAPLARALDIAGWAIIAAFALEYLANLALASNRRTRSRSCSTLMSGLISRSRQQSLRP